MTDPHERGESAPATVPVGELGYAEASRELDEIVAFFEDRHVDVDLLVAHLQRATAIVEELDRRLRRTKLQVEELVPRLASIGRPATPQDVDGSQDVDDDLSPMDDGSDLIDEDELGS